VLRYLFHCLYPHLYLSATEQLQAVVALVQSACCMQQGACIHAQTTVSLPKQDDIKQLC
jgi:hypothetical protein